MSLSASVVDGLLWETRRPFRTTVVMDEEFVRSAKVQKKKKIDLDLKIKWLFFLTQHNVLILGENTRPQSAGGFFFVRIICKKKPQKNNACSV